MTSITCKHSASKGNDLLVSFMLTLVFFVAAHTSYTILFETNDDILFSMLIHGYGISAYPTNFLPVSNTLIAVISHIIPTIFTIPGYITLTMGLLLVSLWAILYFLLRLNFPYIIVLPVYILVFMRAVFVPQFTVTSGLLTVAAIMCLCAYVNDRSKAYIPIMVVLATFGYLLRAQQFFLLVCIALPLLPWKSIVSIKPIRLAACVTIITVGFSAFADHHVKNAPEIRDYTDFLDTMIPILNYGAAWHLAKRDDILKKHGYTSNDIHILRRCFHITPRYTNTKAIAEMLNELGPTFKQAQSLQKGAEALKAFLDFQLLPLLVLGLILLIALPLNRKQRLLILCVWLIAIGFFFYIGLMGRPGQLRIYYPIACFALVAPLLISPYQAQTVNRCAFVCILSIALFCAAWNVQNTLAIAQKGEQWVEDAREDMRQLPTDEPIFSWGGSFPYELIYPVFGNYKAYTQYDIPLFGGYTSAPFSTTVTLANQGKGFLERMRTPLGVLSFDAAGNCCEKNLKIFAKEHLDCRVECQKIGFLRPRANIIRAYCK